MAIDPICEAFITTYQIIPLLEDLQVQKVQRVNESNVVSLCPFHKDTMPSFSMNIDNGLFICYACQVKGNLYNFVQLAYNMDFKQAREFLLEKSGLGGNVNLEDFIFMRNISNRMKEEDKIADFVFPIVPKEVVERMYEEKDPHGYLLSRGYSAETIEYFECGYTKHYLGKTYNIQERITIPGHDPEGNVCGFIGKTPVNAVPKYLYTAGYPKSHTIFNLHRAKHHCKDGLILVEGSLDAMRIHDLGYPNVGAILGAKLSEHQFNLLRQYTNKIYVMFDGDKAGYLANKDAIEMTKDVLDVYYVPIGKYKDPGEIMDKKTLDEFLQKAKSWSIYTLQARRKWRKRY